MRIKLIKEVVILSSKMTIKYNKSHNGGSFSMIESEIEIGIKNIKTDPLYVLSIISHEVMEVLYCSLGCRFANGRTRDNYLFNFDHQAFENITQLHTEILIKFIDYK